ncbi:MAG: tRNA pseudouridine(55) synthase TruB [Flavobacteriales bacterium]|nr:tRNA pseudouridine(55) synthase TruB [Flavobacteriales bacterium]
MSGAAILVDKPLEWTSFNVVSKFRWAIRHHLGVKRYKIGHAGTLDPLATGLLILCAGRYTKRAIEFMSQEKEYTGTITLGATRPSYDMETEIDKEYPYEHITREMVESVFKGFIGDQMQQPPIYSAKQVAGKRAYESARKGTAVELAPCPIHIDSLELTAFSLPELEFRVVCSKGTYIRSLAHDIGKALDSGGYLSSLRRTQSGPYRVEDAVQIEDFVQSLHSEASI